MGRRSKQPKRGHVGALSKQDLKEIEELRKNPQRLASLIQKLQSRSRLGVAGRSELDMLAKLETLSKQKAPTPRGKNGLQEVFDDMARDRKPRKPGAARATPITGDIRFVSGGAPSLGKRR
ncbi:hypothetical protein [Rhodococcus sp. (in: high G+C Gram-positive bacteria)]|uniref:hypothetical protein n=1 Tax=Rhodococcus sp. TaxID=1831 RepID=UPI003B8A6A9D